MKVQDLFENSAPEGTGVRSILHGIVDWWNRQLDPQDRASRLYAKDTGRVWTRGDGTRYRDPARIVPYDDSADRFELISRAWEAIKQLPGTQPAGEVSGEFASDRYAEAIKFRNATIVNRGTVIEVISRTRTSNPNSVWRQK